MTDPPDFTRRMVARYLETHPTPELTDADVDAVVAELTRRGTVEETAFAGLISRLAEFIGAAAARRLVQGHVLGLANVMSHLPPPGVHVPVEDATLVGEQMALDVAVQPFTDEQCRLYLLLRGEGRTRREALTALEGVFGIRLLVDEA